MLRFYSAPRSDIQGYDDPTTGTCVELDLIEGNKKAVQATLHTRQGHGQDGTCNQDGAIRMALDLLSY